VALVFGDERHGLTNAQVLRCSALSAVPTLADQPSINLAQSIVLYSYELRMAQLDARTRISAPRPTPAADADMRELEATLRTVLERSRFLADAERHALRDLLAPLQRGGLSRPEVKLWVAALHTLGRALSE
jgi:tRNA/rRNA methyltransferase/tRNA (cytidine32/uridine32-2'-O)-methyltransferase